jgi:hypothetical protein
VWPGDSDTDSDVSDVTEQRSRRHEWHLCGKRVCFSNFCHLLGTSSPTVRKQLKGIPDGRHTPRASGLSLKARHVDFWFYELYHSAAEPLPIQPRKNHRSKVDSDVWLDDEPWFSAADFSEAEAVDDGPAEDWNPDSPSVTSLTSFTIAAQATVVGLPVRYIQHQRVHDMYWIFQASWEVLKERSPTEISADMPCPSYSLFRDRWKKVWSRYIKIREVAQMAQCQTCWELTRSMNKKHASLAARAQAAKDLAQHHKDQYTDRTIYWSMRWASRALGSVLCIIIDSMDKTKMCWPRWDFDRKPKSLDGINRPRFVFTLGIAHGWCTCAFVQALQKQHFQTLDTRSNFPVDRNTHTNNLLLG